MKYIFLGLFSFFVLHKANAQDKQADKDKKSTQVEVVEDDDSESPIKIMHDSSKNKWTISIGGRSKVDSTQNKKTADGNNAGQTAKRPFEKKKNKAVDFDVALDMDLGLNYLQDRSNYNAPNFSTSGLNFPGITGQNFELKQANSWNVNLYPIRTRFNLYKKTLRLQTQLGFQIYNFRFNDDVTFVPNGNQTLTATNDLSLLVNANNPNTLSKNKLGVSYLSLPVVLQYRPKVNGNTRLHFGAGVMAGYRLQSWTKQVSDQQGKVKQRNVPGFNDYNLNGIAEIGLGKITFYGTYSFTNLFSQDLEMYPIAFGIRL